MRRRMLTPLERFRIRTILAACGLTQEEAAKQMGVTDGHFGNQLAGRYSISEEQIAKLVLAIKWRLVDVVMIGEEEVATTAQDITTAKVG